MPYTPWQRTMSSDPEAEPVVEDPKLPEMTDEAPKPQAGHPEPPRKKKGPARTKPPARKIRKWTGAKKR